MYNRYFFFLICLHIPFFPVIEFNSIILAASPPIVSKSPGGGSARQGRAVKERSTICVAPQHPKTKKGVVTPQTIATIRKLAESVDILGCDDNLADRIAFNYSMKAGDEDS